MSSRFIDVPIRRKTSMSFLTVGEIRKRIEGMPDSSPALLVRRSDGGIEPVLNADAVTGFFAEGIWITHGDAARTKLHAEAIRRSPDIQHGPEHVGPILVLIADGSANSDRIRD
jgi:hypothetical protein